MHRILAINVGSTSVKLAFFEDRLESASKNAPIREGTDEERLSQVNAETIAFLDESGIRPADLSAVAARGGVLRPLEGGTYAVSEAMLRDLREEKYGSHPSNLSARAAHGLAGEAGIPAFVVDPVTVDEMDRDARTTGIPSVSRRSIFHALSQRAAARRASEALGKSYRESNFVVAHLGGGISVGAHHRGRVVDVNNALDGDGPIAPERAGTVPAGSLAELCLSGEHSRGDIEGMLTGKGGIKAHLGTSDMREVEGMVGDGNEKAAQVVEAMAYTISKEIGAMAAALGGKVDAVVLTGGLASWSRLTDTVREKVGFIAPLLVYPENLEMKALAEGALRVLNGEEDSLTYD